jgi:linoleoyl-CoA desaturase
MQQIRFIDKDKDRNLFFATLRSRVDQYFKANGVSRHHNKQMVFKTIILLSAYILPFICILFLHLSTAVNLALWSFMGIALAGIGMSIMHDANHGSYSASGKINYWLGHTLNLLGGSVFNWKLQHNILHHTYTNVIDMDDDIDDKLILRFSPHTEVKWYHKFQFIYAFLFYGILTAYWVFLKDFLQYNKYIKKGVNKESKEQNRIILFKMILAKILYVVAFLVIPLSILHMPAGSYVSGFFLMHFVAGLILTVTFQLAHTVENTTHPLPDESGTIENNWAIHQMNTTVNFSRNNKLISWYVGGLNFQIEHHLFPNVCHVHYPAIAPIVKQTAEEFNIPYMENESLLQAVNSHIRMLKNFGKPAAVLKNAEKAMAIS